MGKVETTEWIVMQSLGASLIKGTFLQDDS